VVIPTKSDKTIERPATIRLLRSPSTHRGSSKNAIYHFRDHVVVGRLRKRDGVKDIITAMTTGKRKYPTISKAKR
jgi:hypothetical protein